MDNKPLQMRVHFDVEVAQDKNVTTAALSLPVDGPPYFAVGSARRHPADEHNPMLGVKLAMARLFEILARDYMGDVEELFHPSGGETKPQAQLSDRFMEAFRK